MAMSGTELTSTSLNGGERRFDSPNEYELAGGGAERGAVIFHPFGGPRMQVHLEIQAESCVYRLRGPFIVDIEYLSDGTVFASHRELPVYGYGQTYDEAVEAFAAMFDFQWEELVEEDEGSLTPQAKKYRHLLQNAVQEVRRL